MGEKWGGGNKVEWAESRMEVNLGRAGGGVNKTKIHCMESSKK